MMFKLWIRYGLGWRRPYPTLTEFSAFLRMGALTLLVLGVWGWMMDRDYRDSARSEAREATRMLVDCLNGNLKVGFDTGTGDIHYAVCRPADNIPVPRGGLDAR